METGQAVQESALHAGRQAWWPLDTMACSLEDASTISSSYLLGWDPQLCYIGLGLGAMGTGAGDSDSHSDTHAHAPELELFLHKCMESPVSEASTAAATGWTMQKDAMAMPAELDELLMSLWDSDDKELAVGFSSCSTLKETSATSSQSDDHSGLSSILPTVPTSPDKIPTPAQAELSASSTSHCNLDPRRTSDTDTGGAQQQHQTTRANSSSKRSAPEEKGAEGSESSKRSRKALPCSNGDGTVAAYPFAVLKPGGADGSVTLADINRWILTPPARPVRHPVGEFACAPRVSAGNRPAPSGRTVAGFTRLHTAGRGTITIVRTRG